MCLYPTSFTFLWQLAVVCGLALIVGLVLLRLRRTQFGRGDKVLMFAMGIVSFWSLGLAYLASQHHLTCAGIHATVQALQQDVTTSQTLQVYEVLVLVTLLVAVVLTLTSIVRYQRRAR